MSEPKHLHSVRADVERTGRDGTIRTGRVALLAIPAWLKGGNFAAASLTPKSARLLAMQLLAAAEKAEEKW